MNPLELKIARMRRKITGKQAASVLHLTVDGYFKKEHGDAAITLAEALALTNFYKFTIKEFVDIFFDGELPFSQEDRESYDFNSSVCPLMEARQRAGLTLNQVAEHLGINIGSYMQREKGSTRISLDQCAALSKLFGLSFDEFNDIFFRSNLHFRKEDISSYVNIITQKGA